MINKDKRKKLNKVCTYVVHYYIMEIIYENKHKIPVRRKKGCVIELCDICNI